MSKNYTSIGVKHETKRLLEDSMKEFSNIFPFPCDTYDKLLQFVFDPEIRKAWGETYFKAWVEKQASKVG